MYVQFIKIFRFDDSNKLRAVGLILAYWAQKRLIPTSTNDVRRVNKNFSLRRFEQANGSYTHFRLLSPKTFDSHFLEILYVLFMKIFHFDDSNKLIR